MRGNIRLDRASRPVILLLAMAAALLLAGFRGAQDTGRIVGRVTDHAGNPVAGAAVVARHADPQVPGRTTRTGDSGGFQLTGLPAGRYAVRAERDGLAPAEQAVELERGEREAVILRLRPARR
jgi:uncharacterized protein (DUF2141 family)